MPAFSGLTREEEEDEEEHATMQLRALLESKREFRFFSQEFIKYLNPHFRAKKEKDPEWRPGMERQAAPARGRSRKPQPIPAPASVLPLRASVPVTDPVVEETELSTNLADFADFFQ